MIILVVEPPIVTTFQPDPVVVDTFEYLWCFVTGDTPINIVWEHILMNGTAEVVFSGNDKTGGSFFLMVAMDDYGMYRCSASSYFGMNSSTIDIIRAGEYNCCKSHARDGI